MISFFAPPAHIMYGSSWTSFSVGVFFCGVSFPPVDTGYTFSYCLLFLAPLHKITLTPPPFPLLVRVGGLLPPDHQPTFWSRPETRSLPFLFPPQVVQLFRSLNLKGRLRAGLVWIPHLLFQKIPPPWRATCARAFSPPQSASRQRPPWKPFAPNIDVLSPQHSINLVAT